LFTDFAPQPLASHPAEVKAAHAPLLALLTELMTEADRAGKLHPGTSPRRAAALIMQTVMVTAQSSTVSDDGSGHPVAAAEVWEFCSAGFARCGEVHA
jgi:hypothetical protein